MLRSDQSEERRKDRRLYIFNSFQKTHLACKEVSTDLDYDLVVLIGRLVPGHHHLCAGQVLQLVYLQPQSKHKDNLRVNNWILICSNELR